jgi:hypothetical protein
VVLTFGESDEGVGRVDQEADRDHDGEDDERGIAIDGIHEQVHGSLL